MNQVGLTNLVADSTQAYIEFARSLASDIPALASLRESLRDRMQKSGLMNIDLFTRDLEAAYKNMWANWCDS